MLDPGDEAPDFVGRDHNGQTVKLADLKGKKDHSVREVEEEQQRRGLLSGAPTCRFNR